MNAHSEMLLAIANNKARAHEARAVGRAVRNMLIVIGVPIICLAWHYRFLFI